MGNVIYFQKAKKKKEEKFNQSTKKTQTATEKATKEYPAVLNPLKDGSSWDARFDACTNFCEFFISGFDPAYSDYIKKNKNLEKEYQYKFGTMKPEKLEEELVDCLTKIVKISPEKREEDKTKILYQAARLFELEEILSDIFYKELMKE
jgi:hypothetical protein